MLIAERGVGGWLHGWMGGWRRGYTAVGYQAFCLPPDSPATLVSFSQHFLVNMAWELGGNQNACCPRVLRSLPFVHLSIHPSIFHLSVHLFFIPPTHPPTFHSFFHLFISSSILPPINPTNIYGAPATSLAHPCPPSPKDMDSGLSSLSFYELHSSQGYTVALRQLRCFSRRLQDQKFRIELRPVKLF